MKVKSWKIADPLPRLPRALVFLLGVAVILELIAPFFAKSYGVDGPSQLNLISQFTGLVSRGVLFPRWAPEGVFGFGIGSFYFYPPVTFYISAFVRLITGVTDPPFLYQMTGLCGTVLSFFAVRPLLRLLGASKYGVNWGALLYAFAPLRIAEIYSRSSISSHFAYTFVPLVWFGLIGIIQSRGASRGRWIVILGFSAALLALSSVPLALATGLCIALAGVVAWRKITFLALLEVVLAALLALGISAFHFSAVLAAMPFAQLSDLTVVNPEFIFNNLIHFSNVPALYHVGILYLSWLLVCFAYFWTRRSEVPLASNEEMLARISILVGIFFVLLEIPALSHPLWGQVQPFKLIQGCWRFYIHFVLMGSVAVAIASTPRMRQVARAICWLLVLGAIGPALFVVMNWHLYSHGTGPGGDPTEYLPIYTIHAQVEGYARLKQHAFDPEMLASLHPGEFLQMGSELPNRQDIVVGLDQPQLVTFHRFYWPYWHLYANGKEITSNPDSIGRAMAVLPSGRYTATWQLKRSPLERTGIWISALTLSGALLFGAGSYWRKNTITRGRPN